MDECNVGVKRREDLFNIRANDVRYNGELPPKHKAFVEKKQRAEETFEAAEGGLQSDGVEVGESLKPLSFD